MLNHGLTRPKIEGTLYGGRLLESWRYGRETLSGRYSTVAGRSTGWTAILVRKEVKPLVRRGSVVSVLVFVLPS